MKKFFRVVNNIRYHTTMGIFSTLILVLSTIVITTFSARLAIDGGGMGKVSDPDSGDKRY
jgi:hypothetical protein